MADKYLIIILVCLTLSAATGDVQTVNGKIKITVGTTSACGHTVNFIAELVPVYEEFKQYLDIEFVPWGRTRYENGVMVCQFGPNDCWANRLQRCVLNMLKDDQDAQVRYMGCEFTRPLPAFLQGTYKCAHDAELSIIDVDYCMSTSGGALEKPAQEASVKPMQTIDRVPFIVFNDVIDQDNHNQARTRLRSLICFALADDPGTNVTNCRI